MKNISTGFGLCAIAAAVALYPVLDRFAPIGKEAHAGVPVSAITSAALAQTAPTIVWYGSTTTSPNVYYENINHFLFRAWSDGRVEGKRINMFISNKDCGLPFCFGEWFLINNPNDGLSAASDSNFDSKVDGADLALLLTHWGDAPRHDIPPSDCPLNLINP